MPTPGRRSGPLWRARPGAPRAGGCVPGDRGARRQGRVRPPETRLEGPRLPAAVSALRPARRVREHDAGCSSHLAVPDSSSSARHASQTPLIFPHPFSSGSTRPRRPRAFCAYTGCSQCPQPLDPKQAPRMISQYLSRTTPPVSPPNAESRPRALGSRRRARCSSAQSTKSSSRWILGWGRGGHYAVWDALRAAPEACSPPRAEVSGTNKGHEEAYGSRL